LTKKQRELNKQKEAELKEEANKRNQQMTEEQKNKGSWAVVGRYEKRHLVKKIKQ
jgi:hypothetical protein